MQEGLQLRSASFQVNTEAQSHVGPVLTQVNTGLKRLGGQDTVQCDLVSLASTTRS